LVVGDQDAMRVSVGGFHSIRIAISSHTSLSNPPAQTQPRHDVTCRLALGLLY
jgi:hypothetical protein